MNILAEIALKYGNNVQKINVPSSNVFYVARARSSNALSNFDTEVRRALDNPISSNRLDKMVSSGSSVALIIDDITRPTPTRKILQVILERLRQKGVGEKMSVL